MLIKLSMGYDEPELPLLKDSACAKQWKYPVSVNKTSPLMLHSWATAVCSEIHTKHTKSIHALRRTWNV